MGFANTTDGSELWRSVAGVTNPITAVDFEQVDANGFGDPVNRQRFFSQATISQGAISYLYIVAGNSSAPLEIFVQQD